MAAVKENTGIQIALIIFVILTIVLSVTTFMFYKETEEANVAKKENETAAAEADGERDALQARIDRLKVLVGVPAIPDDATVDRILADFAKDQSEHAQTYPESRADDTEESTYPRMLRFLTNTIDSQQAVIAQKDAQIARLKKDYLAKVATLEKEISNTETSFKGQAVIIKNDKDVAAADRKKHEEALAAKDEVLRTTQAEILAIQDANKRDVDTLTRTIIDKDIQIEGTKIELEATRVIDLEAPDGFIVWVNQAKRTAYISLGYADGLRRQMTFSVYDHDVANALNAKPKGAIEVIRIDKEHLAVARVTEDDFTNPIVKGDRIASQVFHPGRPERFAIAGLVDIDGDGRSDLDMLAGLIRRNGAVVDAFVDDEGNRSGTISPSTKYLIMGERPTEKSEQKVLNAYNRILTEATKYGVKSMPLADFLDYMGYQGRERSIGLGRSANPEDFKPGAKKSGSPFRRRPSGAY